MDQRGGGGHAAEVHGVALTSWILRRMVRMRQETHVKEPGDRMYTRGNVYCAVYMFPELQHCALVL